jgi:hypothetical protein
LRNREENGNGQHSIERVCEGGGKFGSEEINIQLKIARAVDARDDE